MVQNLQNYELYLILNPELDSKSLSEEITKVQTILEEAKATNVQTTEEGVKRLSYPIKKHKNGFYLLITFDLDLTSTPKTMEVQKKLNLRESIIRYLLVNQTDFWIQKAKEKLRETEITNHRDLNKGKKQKVCLSKFLGIRAVDYKNVDYLNQFTSPYAKIFARTRTGTSAKFQRKISQAIKRARHMALMPFTDKYMD